METPSEPISPRSATSSNLDPDAAQALKKFIKKNKPPPTHFASEPGPEYKADSEEPVQAEESNEGIDFESLKPCLRKFDIFDNIDEEREAEFDTMFTEVRAESNYDQFMKQAKRMDPNKFMTSNGVNVKEDGLRVLS